MHDPIQLLAIIMWGMMHAAAILVAAVGIALGENEILEKRLRPHLYKSRAREADPRPTVKGVYL